MHNYSPSLGTSRKKYLLIAIFGGKRNRVTPRMGHFGKVGVAPRGSGTDLVKED